MLLFNFGIIVVIVCNIVIILATTDYCSPYLCKGHGKHIGCNNNGDFSPKCPDDRVIIKMSNSIMNFIVNKHNHLRSLISMGLIDGYDTADSMSQMHVKKLKKLKTLNPRRIHKNRENAWDDELANLAEMNVKTCKFGHDKCFKTDKFPYTGQNLYEIRSNSKFKWNSITETIDYFIERWFNEYKSADMKIIARYRSNGRKIGHFTQIVQSKSTKIGCAMVRYKTNRGVTLYFLCNYSHANILNAPVYTTGKPCSKCSKGCSKIYPGLCLAN